MYKQTEQIDLSFISGNKSLSFKYITLKQHLILGNIIPCPATQKISNAEFKKIQRNVENDAVKPNDTSPAPPNTSHPCKAPVCINSYECGNLRDTRENKILELNNLLYSRDRKYGQINLYISIILQVQLTSCAIIKAVTSKRPGRSRKEKFLDRVTKMRA